MTKPSFVVLPVSGSGPHPDQETTDIASTVQRALHERSHPEPEHPGPIKQILAQQDSLYKYINWENPIRTLVVYLGATSILFGAHYLPLTQTALKAGVTTLGAVSIGEFTSRFFSGNSLSARLRPKEYKIPEPTLNATLKDIHDFVQYAVVQVQRIIFGQDLAKTFATFLGTFGFFWLTKFASPFWFAVVALNSIFVAPLIHSDQGRRAVRNANVRVQELANVAVQKGKQIGHDGQVKASELASKGKQTAANVSAQTRDTASNVSDRATELSSKGQQAAANFSGQARNTASGVSDKASELSSKGRQTAADISGQARDTDPNVSNKATEYSSKGRQTASDYSGQAMDTASDLSGTAVENIRELPQLGTNAVNSTYDNAKGYLSTPSAPTSNHTNGHTNGDRSIPHGTSNDVPHYSNSASETTKQTTPGSNIGTQLDSDYRQYYTDNTNRTAPEVYTSNQPDLSHRQQPVSYLPYQNGGVKSSAAPHDMANRPRGASQSNSGQF